MGRILNIGSMNVDYVYSVPHFVQAGETIATLSRQEFVGGKGLNQSVAVARSGGKAVHAGMWGEGGGELVNFLKNEGVNTEFIAKSDLPTGHTIIQVNEAGQNCILLYPGANYGIDEPFLNALFENFTSDDIALMQNEVSNIPYAIEMAEENGLCIAFNPSPFTAEINSYPLEYVDWFLLNEIEGEFLTGKQKPNEILSEMSKKFPNAVTILTLGAAGVVANYNGEMLSFDAARVKAVDTTAAGDTFTGYFLSGISKGEDFSDAIKLAIKAAAISVSRKGAAGSIPALDEVI